MFSVNSGDTVTAVAKKLDRQKIVFSDMAFKMAIRLQGGRVQGGEYEIPAGASAWDIADMFARGRVATTTVVIPEGLTILQIRDLLRAAPQLTGDVECDDGRSVCDIADGDIFPDTYYVARGTKHMAAYATQSAGTITRLGRCDYIGIYCPTRNPACIGNAGGGKCLPESVAARNASAGRSNGNIRINRWIWRYAR